MKGTIKMVVETIISHNERVYAYKDRYFFAGRCIGSTGLWLVDEVNQKEVHGSKIIARVFAWKKTRELKYQIINFVDGIKG